MSATLVFLPSPLLGPSAWGPVVAEMRERRWTAHVCRPSTAIETAADVLSSFVSCVPDREPVVLVAHSNAGLFVPTVRARRPIAAAVYVDAALTSVDGPTTLAPAPLYEHLEGLADDHGVLPPWSRWWDADDLAGLFPGGLLESLLEDGQPRLPLHYFRSTVEAPADWQLQPSAYIAFGNTYEAEQRQARSWGWPVLPVRGRHLHMLVDPAEVATALETALHELGQHA